MLAGRNDLKQLTPYVKRMAEYSDDGVTQPGAYGKRWRGYSNWGDQINRAVAQLKANLGDRRVVIQMWDPADDGLKVGWSKDVPCNLTALPYVSGGALHLTIFNRSNDVIWGLYGANAVQFSMLLEYLAGRIGLPVGTMTTISNNFHGYLSTLPDREHVAADPQPYAYAYERQHAAPRRMYADWDGPNKDETRERISQEDLRIFFEHGPVESATKARWPWLRQVVVPMALAHLHWRKNRGEARYTGALEIMERVQASDWRAAGEQWLQRRYDKWKRAADDGALHDD